MTTITTRTLQTDQPKPTPYFIRDDKVKGFAAKVNPTGSIKLIAEVRHKGRTVRKTIGQHPHTIIGEARKRALTFIQQVRTEQADKSVPIISLRLLFENYIKGDRLKPNTLIVRHLLRATDCPKRRASSGQVDYIVRRLSPCFLLTASYLP